MSRTMPIDVACSYCGARPGEKCRTLTSGKPYEDFHEKRAEQAFGRNAFVTEGLPMAGTTIVVKNETNRTVRGTRERLPNIRRVVTFPLTGFKIAHVAGCENRTMDHRECTANCLVSVGVLTGGPPTLPEQLRLGELRALTEHLPAETLVLIALPNTDEELHISEVKLPQGDDPEADYPMCGDQGYSCVTLIPGSTFDTRDM